MARVVASADLPIQQTVHRPRSGTQQLAKNDRGHEDQQAHWEGALVDLTLGGGALGHGTRDEGRRRKERVCFGAG
jgi:uncharacterized protein YcfJ